ncbi:MAG: 50S ribosomal protein L13 [Thermoplasmata archaeon]|uniref:Large ribosomal subunit protein uL13 n=1 Tax=Candidatus Sysuiplasma superficiale TaxID=2823368 RepID=A0A8J7YN33_9ARCH|nr:50S ribosomal protein L13 [Candidatus Sysuiplasma superficiale]MBX8645017.1 50S ribosomal protein L13 [Candidatus Sysuiplasma superficiale]MCL5437384.1 50S ribosomal protein L13 [Candidatus Thermoplasmatota archaeon]
MIVVDADGAVLGRLSSSIAKRLLNGEEITVINAEKALVSGSAERSYQEYFSAYQRGKAIKGPYYPRMPDGIFRRTVRGMLPMKTARGKSAYRRLKVYTGVPKQIGDIKPELQKAPQRGKRYTRLGEISELLGARVNR